MSIKQRTEHVYQTLPTSVKRAVTTGLVAALALVPAYAQQDEIAFPAGQGEISIVVQTVDNTIAQRDRALIFEILPSADYDIVEGDNEHTYIIQDNDMPQADFVSGLPTQGYRQEGDSFYVSLTGATSAEYPIVIDVDATGTAQEGVHYTLSPINIPAGQEFAGAYEVARILSSAPRGPQRTLELALPSLTTKLRQLLALN